MKRANDDDTFLRDLDIDPHAVADLATIVQVDSAAAKVIETIAMFTAPTTDAEAAAGGAEAVHRIAQIILRASGAQPMVERAETSATEPLYARANGHDVNG